MTVYFSTCKPYICIYTFTTRLCLCVTGTTGLKNVSLEVIPAAVQRGQHATLQCHYDLENAPLYSVKWYRGRHEFYRYAPSELPNNKIFPFAGIHVDVSFKRFLACVNRIHEIKNLPRVTNTKRYTRDVMSANYHSFSSNWELFLLLY